MLPKPLCHFLITLTPKVKQPKHISQFQPICLSNVLHNFFSKVLANRLKHLLPQLVSDHQSAFMSDRLITDNVMVAFETLHYMRNQRTRKKWICGNKIGYE